MQSIGVALLSCDNRTGRRKIGSLVNIARGFRLQLFEKKLREAPSKGLIRSICSMDQDLNNKTKVKKRIPLKDISWGL